MSWEELRSQVRSDSLSSVRIKKIEQFFFFKIFQTQNLAGIWNSRNLKSTFERWKWAMFDELTLVKYSQPPNSSYYYPSSLVYKLNQPKIETVRLIFAGSRQKFSLPKLMFRHFKASFEESETYSDRSKIFQKFIFEPDVIFGGFFKYMFFNSTCFFTFFHPFLSLIY